MNNTIKPIAINDQIKKPKDNNESSMENIPTLSDIAKNPIFNHPIPTPKTKPPLTP